MRYLLIISHDDSFTPTETLIRDIGTWIKEMEHRGVRVYGNPLRPPVMPQPSECEKAR